MEKMTPDHPEYFEKIFLSATKERKKEPYDPLEKLIAEEFGQLSLRLDRSVVQESVSVRNVLLTRALAKMLMNEEGKLEVDLLPKTIALLKKHFCTLGPNREVDTLHRQHMIDVLEKLHNYKNLQRILLATSRPIAHKFAEEVIRETLQIPHDKAVTDAHARQAALSAWLCYLRQSVGSCFGTAPAILVHQEQPEVFLKDLQELLGTGRLKRTFGGVEYSVPFTLSWGSGDLRKVLLIDSKDQFLSKSPGILRALEMVGIPDGEEKIKNVLEVDKEVVITAEEVIKRVLQKFLGVTQKEVLEYEERGRNLSRDFFHMGMVRALPTGIPKSKNDLCEHYLKLFATAKQTFKALADNALLKCWEFTVASFAETKPGFTRWNMYTSLGFSTDEPGGIGACLYQNISEKLARANQRVQELQAEYEMVYSQFKYIEARFRSASTEKEVQWVRIEYEAKKNEFKTLEELRNVEHHKAERFANLLQQLLDSYDELFPRYFQEIFDPDMHEVTQGPFDDSPAGFRLLYKHGRTNTSQWSLIYTPQEYIDALAAFFTATEIELLHSEEYQGLEQDLSDLITKLIAHIRDKQFLLTSFIRMAKAYQTSLPQDPLEQWQEVSKKPWAYVSGGTLNNLLKSYFCIDHEITEKGRWVENPMELLVFFIDTLKTLPPQLLEVYTQKSCFSILTHSPTHAYNLKPCFPSFREAIMNDAFSYTWVRDQLIKPAEIFVDYLFLDQEMMGYMLQKLVKHVPKAYRPRFTSQMETIEGKKNPREFRESILEILEKDGALKSYGVPVLSSDEIDHELYTALPLFSKNELFHRMEKILEALPQPPDNEKILEEMHRITDSWPSDKPYVAADQLKNLVKCAIIQGLKSTSSTEDLHLKIQQAAQNLGYAMPRPIVFADTNWVRDSFAFLVNPGTGKLSLWRVDYTGSRGFPMSSWDEWLNGSRKDRTWGLYPQPFEYKLAFH